jgi:hypothetical protein
MSESVVNDKTGEKSAQPIVAAPIKPVPATVKTPAPAKLADRAHQTALPSSAPKAAPPTISTTQPLTQKPSLAGKPFTQESAPNPINSSSENGGSLPTSTPPSASVPSEASDEQARKAKERRDKRRAIITTPRLRKSCDDYGR